jgi:hypothetical protein
MTRSVCILLSLLSVTLAGQASAQVNAQFADINDDIEMVRSLVRLERKAVVEQGMALTATESPLFWPVYAEYEIERTAVNDRKVKLITDYAAAYPSLSDEVAKTLLEDYFDVEADMLDVKEKYARRLGKIFPVTRVARFIQLENKLDALVNLSLAEQIPLAP